MYKIINNLYLPSMLGMICIFSSNYIFASSAIQVDFGSGKNIPGTNIYTASQMGGTLALLDKDNQPTDVSINLTGLNGRNTKGSTTPDPALHISLDASSDSLFGNVNPFQGNTFAAGNMTIDGLEPDNAYNLSFFSSRMSVSDDRETSFTISGLTQETLILNASNNSGSAAIAQNIQPNDQGEINVEITAGSGNTNNYRFFYLNALTLSAAQEDTAPVLTLTGDTPVTLTRGESYEELMATANDDVDGDLSTAVQVAYSASIDHMSVIEDEQREYIATYTVIDSADNQSQITRSIVFVPDNIAPIITLNSESHFYLNQYQTYEDPGVVISDNIDNGLFATISDDIDTELVGTYTVTYIVSDLDGNESQALRTVEVIAAAPTPQPYVKIDFGDTITTENGFNVYRVIDQTTTLNLTDLTGESTGIAVTVEGFQVAHNNDGTTAPHAALGLPVTATEDSLFGNTVGFIGSIKALATLTLSGLQTDTPYNLEFFASRMRDEVDNRETQYLVQGENQALLLLNAMNNIDMSVTADSIYSDANGEIIVEIQPGDNNDSSHGFFYLGALTLHSLQEPLAPDTEAPLLTLIGANPLVLSRGTPYDNLGASAQDNRDGNISSQVNVSYSDTVDTLSVVNGSARDYVATYQVSDQAGNTSQVTRDIQIIADSQAPIIVLAGDSVVYVQQGDNYDDPGANVIDNIDSALLVNVTGEVNTAILGTYELVYSASDLDENQADVVTRTVHVLETVNQQPVITLTGDNEISIEIGAVYNELGFSATDAEDGDITLQVVIDDTELNVNQAGIYQIYYNVADSAGLEAATRTRQVTVQDTSNPTINLALDANLTLSENTRYKDSDPALLIDGDEANDHYFSMYCKTNKYIEFEFDSLTEIDQIVIENGKKSHNGKDGLLDYDVLAHNGACNMPVEGGEHRAEVKTGHHEFSFSSPVVTDKIRLSCRDAVSIRSIREIKIIGRKYQGRRPATNCPEVDMYVAPYPNYSTAVYLPPGYNDDPDKKYPLIISLHGKGGETVTTDHSAVLDEPAGFIKQMKKQFMQDNIEAVVIAPHFLEKGKIKLSEPSHFLNSERVHKIANMAKAEFKIDPDRIVATGLSSGGLAVKGLIENYRDTIYAGFIPVAFSAPNNSELYCHYTKAPIQFHGGSLDEHNPEGWKNLKDKHIPLHCSPENGDNMQVFSYEGFDHDSPLWDGEIYSPKWDGQTYSLREAHNFMLDVRRSDWINN